MAVSLPTAADVRKAREQAARNATDRAEVARTPLLAVLGASDYAVTTVTKVVEQARLRAGERAEGVQHRVAELPQRVSTDELRKIVADLRVQAEQAYAGFAERGERTWGRIRKQPQVEQAITTIETYTEMLDARVDVLVDDAHDAAEKALTTVSRQTRSTGERVARLTQRAAGDAAVAVAEASKEASLTVAEAGADVAGTITEAGDEVAHETRSSTRKAANRTAPEAEPKAAPKTAPKTASKTAPKSAAKAAPKAPAKAPAKAAATVEPKTAPKTGS